MARITEVSDADDLKPADSGKPVASKKGAKGSQNAKSQERPPVISYLIYVIPLLSIAIGVSAHYLAAHKAHHRQMSNYSKTPRHALRAELNLPTSFGERFDILPEPLNGFLYLLNVIFRDLVQTNVGRGVFAIIMSAAMPPFLAMWLDALRPGNSAALSGGVVIAVTLLGQAIMIGCAVPAIYVPVFAIVSWRQATRAPNVIRPLPSPPGSQVMVTLVFLSLSMLPFFWVMLAPPHSGAHFFAAATAFQFFPLFWIPLLFLKKQPQPAHASEPRLAAARAYSLSSYASVPLYWWGLWKTFRPLLAIWRAGGSASAWPDDISRLLFLDTLALSWGFYAIVLIQAEVDLRAVQCGGPRVHRARLLIEDFIFGTTGLLIMGPGFGMGTYYSRREVLAEKARFGITPAFVAKAEAGADVKAE